MNQDKWLTMWRESMQDFTITQVDVSKVRDKFNDFVADGNVKSAVLEVAKYSAKDSDLHYSEDVFDAYYNSLKDHQLITYNRLYKEYIKIKDIEKREKHILHEYIPQDTNKYIYQLLYQCGKTEYVELEKRLLTYEESKKFNKIIFDEDDGQDFD